MEGFNDADDSGGGGGGLTTAVTAAAGAQGPGGAGKADPPGTPLTLTITGSAKYTFDPAPLTVDEYRNAVEEAAKKGKPAKFGAKLPAPPTVDLAVELKNTSAGR